jgi:hybrid cluster-associated redox disulfide protein
MRGPSINDPDMPLCRMFALWPETATVFRLHGMVCFGCQIAPFHTVTDACGVYCRDEAAFRAELGAAVSMALAKAGHSTG